MKYLLHPDAAQDLDNAAAYYQKQAGNPLSQALFVEFERAVVQLLRYPLLGAKWQYGTRRSIMARFPFSIVYLIANDELHIIAVAHQSRSPAYWYTRK